MQIVRKLRDTDLASINYNEDIRGYAVFDARSRRVGEVGSLFVDEAERRIRLFSVIHGEGDGASEGRDDQPPWIVPVDGIASIRGNSVRLDRSYEALAALPQQDAWLRDSEQGVSRIYQHYGYPPFWSAGYAYPPYPFYM